MGTACETGSLKSRIKTGRVQNYVDKLCHVYIQSIQRDGETFAQALRNWKDKGGNCEISTLLFIHLEKQQLLVWGVALIFALP